MPACLCGCAWAGVVGEGVGLYVISDTDVLQAAVKPQCSNALAAVPKCNQYIPS